MASKVIPPPPYSENEQGAASIFCDPELESSLSLVTNQRHYIGRLEGDDGIFSNPYLPVRLQPAEQNLANGWDEEIFPAIDDVGDLVTDTQEKNKVGIEVPLGFEITVTEIVQSESGTWVGFISLDPRAEDLDDDVFADNTRVLYTKAEYVRIKEVYLGVDPVLSSRSQVGDLLAESVQGIPGADTISPTDSEKWVELEPEDVKHQYFNFYDYNQALVERNQIPGEDDRPIYNLDTIQKFQTLKYSEGYFYFVVGSAPRKSEADLINESGGDLELSEQALEESKLVSSEETYQSIRDSAWNNLLEYLNRPRNIYQNLKDEYFIQVARKVNTQSPDPNNERILFAIRADYIDSLPKTPVFYKNNFPAGSQFLQGNNYAVSLPASEIAKRCNIIVQNLTQLKQSIGTSNITVQNANQTDYDIDAQIDFVKKMPDIFREFFHRQAFPLSANKSELYEIIRDASAAVLDKNIIQIGVKDNGELGGDVRETISYVLFSPDPESIRPAGVNDSEFPLQYFDPYATDPTPRSAIALDVALPWLREKFEGVYGSRALHLLLSYESSNKFFGANDTEEKWMEYLSKYMVPPLRIYLSKQLSVAEEQLDCDEIITRLNKAGPVLTFEERLLEEKLYNSEKCMALYYEKYSKSTPAVSPGMSKRELELKAQKTQSGGNILDDQYVKILYTGFFNALDTNSITSLIMACLQKKLGIELTAEAICERAILKLVSAVGTDSVEKTMLANALLTPNSESSVMFLNAYNGAPPFAPDTSFSPGTFGSDGTTPAQAPPELDETYNNAPIAAAMLMSQTRTLAPDEEERVNFNDEKWWTVEGGDIRVNTAVIEATKQLEKTGQTIIFKPGVKFVDQENTSFGQPTPIKYTQQEIEAERTRLKTLGYTSAETDSVLVASGYLMPDPDQLQIVLGDGQASQTPAGGMTGPTGLLPYNYTAQEDARVVEQNAENWLNYMKRTIGLASICELIVGDILDGLQNLIRDPGAFFSGGGAGWWDNFVEGLKRQFSPPVPTLKFPDSLLTDNHMGDYGERLTKTILAMVAQMLGQIVNLLLKNALEQCLEEDSDVGTSGRKPAPGPDVPFPVLEAAGLPNIGDLSNADVLAWIKDILDNLSTGQLCALLRGDATRKTLLACVSRTRNNWISVYQNGVDSPEDISTIFQKIGENINLDICDAIESPTLVNNLCEAVYDRDARCAALLESGLTREECEAQINQEIQDLRTRVAGTADLSLLDLNPLANSLPPICGNDFVIPPGVKDTMERITDNILTNVKGSLMIDLEGLKFFSDPPRALKAVSDPEELKKTHAAFLQIAQKPYKRKCLAFIGDPINHFAINDFQEAPPYSIYSLTYNATTPKGANAVLNNNLEELVPLHAGLLINKQSANLTIDDMLDKALPAQKKADVKAYAEARISGESNAADTENVRQEIISEYSKDIKIKSLESLTIANDQLFTAPLFRPGNNAISAPGFATYSYDEYRGLGVSDNTSTNVYASFPGNFSNPIGNQGPRLTRPWTLDTKLKDIDDRPWTWYYMLRAYTGVDITIEGDDTGKPSPRRNFPLGWLQNYDFWSYDFNPEDPDSLYAGTDFDPYNVVSNAGNGVTKLTGWWLLYTVSPGLRNLVKIAQRIVRESGSTPFKRKDANGEEFQFNLATAFMELTLAEATGLESARLQELYPNLQDYTSNPENGVILSVYKNPKVNVLKYTTQPLKEALSQGGWQGLAEFYSALDSGNSSFDSSLWDQFLEEKSEEISKESQRWGSYDFYYPHFLVFDRYFRDPESQLNAPPQEIIEAFSSAGQKVNQELYDYLSFIPESLLPQSLRAATDQSTSQLISDDIDKIINSAQYNPNILKYELPSQVSSVKLFGSESTSQQIQDVINGVDPGAQVATLADQIDTTNVEKSLIHQNIITPLGENENVQASLIRNVSKLIKGTVTPFPEYPVIDPEILGVIEEVSVSDLTPEEMITLINKQEKYAAGLEKDILDSAELDAIEVTFGGVDTITVFNIQKILEIAEDPSMWITQQEDVVLAAEMQSYLMGSPTNFDITKLDDFKKQSDFLKFLKFFNDSYYEAVNLPSIILTDTQAENLIKQLIDQPENIGALILDESSAVYLPADPPVPPHSVVGDDRITNQVYNFNFAGRLAPDVHKIIEDLYTNEASLNASFASDYASLYSDTVLDQQNYKAQIFGQFLASKLDDKLAEHSIEFGQENLNDIKKFLAIEGFSALQYAYSTQMFSKMKSSRIQNRGYMKKIWKKILKSPLVSDGTDPRCEAVLAKAGIPSDALSQNTETDFFKVDQVKSKIIEFYEKSLCKDVYETNLEGQNATRVSLLEGMVKLVVKVYTLEMCLASVIAWDSFDLEDVFKDTSMAAIILQNISQDFDIEFLSFFATDMLRKENNLTDIQLLELKLGVDGAPQSSLEYLIGVEGENIAGIVKNMFVNSFPISTDLRVSLLKNTDPDYVEDFAREVANSSEYNPEFIVQAGALTGSTGPLEIISDVKIPDNIYTMNFGSGRKNEYAGISSGMNFSYDKNEVDVFGLSAERGARSQNNKNYFHSLPMNWYHEHAPYNYNDRKDKAWNLNASNTLYTGEGFASFINFQNTLFGRADSFSFDNNVETSHGNNINRVLGNIVFEPYVKIEDWGEEERDFEAEVFSNLDENGEPCDQVVLTAAYNVSDYLDLIDDTINIKRKEENNAFRSHIYGYVPLSAWSYFYNNYFLKSLEDSPALAALFDSFGLKPFFKSVKFGMRMTYITANPALSFAPLVENLDVTSHSTPLKNIKSILGRRPYYIDDDMPAVLYELQIPIIEVEKEIVSVDYSQSFTIENSDLIPFNELGIGPGGNVELHYTKNAHQFYYGKLANALLQEIKNSAEFKLMYDYLFPMRRYMALATIMASDGLSTFIPNPTDVLDRTKQSLANIIDNISNSTDYKHLPDPIANLLAERALRAEAGTGAKEPDMTKEILKIVLRTPLLVLKGFVEITDPAIITAKRIIDISNAVASATLAAVKQGVATAKRIVQSGIDAARQILQQLEIQLNVGIGFAKSAAAALPTVQTSEGPEKLSDYVIIENTGEIESWKLELVGPLPPGMSDEQNDQWEEFGIEFKKLQDLLEEYKENKKKLDDLESKKQEIIQEGEIKIKEAEERLKSFYQSPYLLPGIWSAMMPSVIPYGGGINPFPMPLPFVSTFPGMIYLAILFIDAIEEKIHDDIQKTKDPNCEDQL